jgi:hypothetical protein
MEQIIPTYTDSNSDSSEDTKTTRIPSPSSSFFHSHLSTRPTFESESEFMIDSLLPTPTPTPLPLSLIVSEPEPDPDPVTIPRYHPNPHSQPLLEHGLFDLDDIYASQLVDRNTFVGPSSFALGLGLGSELGLGLGSGSGLEGDYPNCPSVAYDFGNIDEKGVLPPTIIDTSGYNHINIDTTPTPFHTQFNPTSSPIAIDQFDSNFGYSIDQFAHSEYALPIDPYLEPALASVQIDSYTYNHDHDHDLRPGLRLDQLVRSPTGLWSPVTSTSQLPSHELDYTHELQPQPQPLPHHQEQFQAIPQYWQDHTPTLAPHYPDLELDLDTDYEMTRDLPFPYSNRNGYNQE